jgi:hypothetical protein
VRSVGWSLTTSTHMTIETSERRPLCSALERQGQTTIDNYATGCNIYESCSASRHLSDSPKHPDRLGAHSDSYSMGNWGLSSREKKLPVWEVGHTPPSSTEVENSWNVSSTPIRVHGVYFIDLEYVTLEQRI